MCCSSLISLFTMNHILSVHTHRADFIGDHRIQNIIPSALTANVTIGSAINAPLKMQGPDLMIIGSSNGGTSMLNDLLNDLSEFATFCDSAMLETMHVCWKQRVDCMFWSGCAKEGIPTRTSSCSMHEYQDMMRMDDTSEIYIWERTSRLVLSAPSFADAQQNPFDRLQPVSANSQTADGTVPIHQVPADHQRGNDADSVANKELFLLRGEPHSRMRRLVL